MSTHEAAMTRWAPTTHGWLGVVVASWALSLGCADVRTRASPPPDFDDDVRPILVARCGNCHGAVNPAAGWNASRFTDAIACIVAPAMDGGDAGVPDAGAVAWPTRLASALSLPDHQNLLLPAELQIVQTWVATGALASRGLMHDPGFADPRSAGFHATLLRGLHWAPMLDPTRSDACGRCHEGAPTRPPGATGSARNAPACTSCHDQPGGPLACSTCHGSGDQAFPPRNPCLFPIPPGSGGAHAVHLGPSAFHAQPFTCTTCHPARTTDFSGDHGNGVVDFAFDPVLAGPQAAYDPTTQSCSVRCHNQGGHRPIPVWTDTTPMTCNDCHTAPPANHHPGPCSSCHAEANATGTSLHLTGLHLNGQVDLGDGSGTCSACHGSSATTVGWPGTGSHDAHRVPSLAAPVACTSCHHVPTQVSDPGHFDTAPRGAVNFGGNAVARGATPTYDPTTQTCTGVACHGAGLGGVNPAPPQWGDTSGLASRCGQCHGIPPPPPHTQATNCESVVCHGGEITPSPTGPQISPAGLALHQNGVIDHGGVGP